VLLVVWVSITALITALWAFLQTQKIGLTGDEPHYLIEAFSLTHFTPHVAWAYQQDFQTHAIFNWAPGIKLDINTGQIFYGPHGIIASHDLGIPILVAPGMAIAGRNGAMALYFAIEVAGLIFIHQRMSRLVRLSRRSRWLFAIAIAGPALWIAGTQLYPDLIGGIFVACALVELAVIEQTRKLSIIGVLVVGIGLGYPPWLEPKNFLPAGVLGVAFIVIAIRRRLPKRAVILTIGVIGVGWLLLLAYNQYYFGHVLGLPQATPVLSQQGVLGTLSLLFDRHQGLFVQVPTVAVGLVGLWLARRLVPVTAIAVLVAVGALLFVNGGYMANPFGGTVLAGRFQWTTLPMLLAWSPYVLKRIDAKRVRTMGMAIVVSVVWIVQAIPIFDGEHYHYQSYYNAMNIPFRPWDPSLYPGWWPGLNHFLPVLIAPPTPQNYLQVLAGVSTVHLLAEIGVLAIICVVLFRLAATSGESAEPHERRPIDSKASGAVALIAGLLIVLGFAIPNRDLPGVALSWSGTSLGSPYVATGHSVTVAQLPLNNGDHGEYRATVSYTLSGSSSSATVSMLKRPLGYVPPLGWSSATTTVLPRGSRTVSTTFHLPPSQIAVTIRVATGGTLVIHNLQLTKISASQN
jgi:hypothetical protein